MFEADFWSLLGQSSPVIVVVYLVLVVMSVTSWMLIFYKFYQLVRAKRRVTAGAAAFDAAQDLDAAMSVCGLDADSCPSRVALEGMDEVERMRGASGTANDTGVLLENVRRALTQQAEGETDRLYGSLGYLATWANVAPLLGLFGTVWGIMSAFTSFTSGGAETMAGVAPGLAEALGTTAAGLMVAIPAALAYNLFLNKLSAIEAGLGQFSRAFLNRVKQELPRLSGPAAASPEA